MFEENAYKQLRDFLVQFKTHWTADVLNKFVSLIDDYFIPFVEELNSNRNADSQERVNEYWHTRITDVKGLLMAMKVETEKMAFDLDAINTGTWRGDTFIPYTYKSTEILPVFTNMIDYLEEIYNSKAEQQGTTGQPKTDFDKSLSEIKNSENQFLKGMEMEKVISHFKPLIEKKSKNGKPFLTPEQFILFLQKAFLKKQAIQKQKINYANGEKGKIIQCFYQFYFDVGVTEYNEPMRKERYIKLIVDNFNNSWSESSIKTYFKPQNQKQKR